jgi:hypothetical protein
LSYRSDKGKLNLVKNFIRVGTRTALLLVVLLLAGVAVSHAQVSFGIRIGPPPRPRVVRVVPRSPGPGYVYIDGYWYPAGNHYRWHDGYWTRPPYEGARWVGPHHDGEQFYAGYWDGDRGHVEHDHRWDRDRRNRDSGRYHDDRRDDRRDDRHDDHHDDRNNDRH